jgi:hypothetical protein
MPIHPYPYHRLDNCEAGWPIYGRVVAFGAAVIIILLSHYSNATLNNNSTVSKY